MTQFFAFPAELQGPLLYGARIILSLAMFSLIAWAIIAIRKRDMQAHGASMLRAYAIGQGASTQAFLGLGWMVAVGTEPLGLLRDCLMVTAWGVNLIVAELIIIKLFAPRRLLA
jgi:hypothetical protein